MSPWQHRTDANFPYQRWQPFPVEVANVHGEKSIGPARDFWWGYEQHNPESPPPGLQGSAPCDIIATACTCDKSCRREECTCLHVARSIMQSERLACASLLADKPTAHVVAMKILVLGYPITQREEGTMFLVFAFDNYYPAGGCGAFDTLEQARRALLKVRMTTWS